MQKKGFTLVELLVVIAIIGILSAIGLTTLHGARERARDAQRKHDLVEIRTAITLYSGDNGDRYPGVSAADVPELLTVTLSNKLVNEYLSRLPVDPIDDGIYSYYYLSNSTTDTATEYSLLANLEGDQAANIFITNSSGFSGTHARSAQYSCASGGGALMVCTASL